MTSLFGISPSCLCDRCRWQLCILPAPVRRFLPVAIEFLPEQVIVVMIVRDCHIEGTPLVLLPLPRHLHIVLADLRVPYRQLPVRRRSCQPLALCLLCRAPLDAG